MRCADCSKSTRDWIKWHPHLRMSKELMEALAMKAKINAETSGNCRCVRGEIGRKPNNPLPKKKPE